jgi:hypothetical protein
VRLQLSQWVQRHCGVQHTFVLFLGPHIARVANAAVLHNGVDFSYVINNDITAATIECATYSVLAGLA